MATVFLVELSHAHLVNNIISVFATLRCKLETGGLEFDDDTRELQPHY
jgi:hypothetical protein